jgi:hypothetical protein
MERMSEVQAKKTKRQGVWVGFTLQEKFEAQVDKRTSINSKL